MRRLCILTIAFIVGWLLEPALAARSASFHIKMDSDPRITSYRQFLYSTPGAFGPYQNIGMPPVDATGNRIVTASCPDTGGCYVSFKAANDNCTPTPEVPCDSPFSNERVLFAQATPPPTTAQGALTGRWALLAGATPATMTVIDADFRPGEVIPATAGPCRSLQAEGNAYMEAGFDMPGSVQFTRDTAVRTENNPQYFSFGDDANVPRCDPLLTVVGAHTYGAAPFDGDDLGGLRGTALPPLTFTVASATPTPPVKPPKPRKPRVSLTAPDAAMWSDPSPLEICTESVTGGTCRFRDEATLVESPPTATCRLQLQSPTGTIPTRFTVVATVNGVDSDRSAPSDWIQLTAGYGADLNGSGTVNSTDFSMLFAPALQLGARSCAGGACACP